MNNKRGPGTVPGKVTIRLPVWVGKGMRSLALSYRIASAGTPTSFRAFATSPAIAFS